MRFFARIFGSVFFRNFAFRMEFLLEFPILNFLYAKCRTKDTMYISVASNLINVVGNCIGIYVMHAGVAGVAWPTFIARLFSAVVITGICFHSDTVRYRLQDIFTIDVDILGKICRVAVPNGMENAVFQFVKVALSSIVAMFGTYQIAANGVAQSIWFLAALMSTALGPVFVTVIGQCMGAGDKVQARYYFRKLIRIAVLLLLLGIGYADFWIIVKHF